MSYKEQSMATAIVKYMKLQHPKVIFKIDAGADANKSSFAAKAVYSKQQYKRGFPDFQIIKPSKHYAGLFLELKADYDCLFNKNGTMKRGSNDHHVEQYEFIKELRENGYAADFCWTIDSALLWIDAYLADVKFTTNDYKFNSQTIADKKEQQANDFFGSRGL